MFHSPGRAGGGVGAGGRAGAAADQRGDAGARWPRPRAAGQMKWTWASMPPAVTIRPSPAMASVPAPIDHARRHALHEVGVAGLADAGDAAVADADVGLDDAPVVDDQRRW